MQQKKQPHACRGGSVVGGMAVEYVDEVLMS